ncbi:MAG: glycoside hydrolase family 95-like protein, partial [Thomasclavelia sp.]|uniref:glycoside hydrolase family 95-like protein n=1 Tax=Thomasclavelia sp. TaxID=3025757 RepID=UPI0039A08B97
MLMQSNMGYINMLPALPDVWSTGHVSGLLARGNFEITMDWQSNNLTNAVILSKGGQDCTIQYPNISKATILDEEGNQIAFTKDANNKITFATEKDKTYTIEDIPEKPIKAPQNAQVYSNGKSTLVTFDAITGVSSYNIYRSDESDAYEKIATVNTNTYTDIYKADAKYKVAAVTKDGEGEMTSTLTPIDIGNIEKMDDRDSLISYTGSWGDWSDGGQYLGTEKYTYTNGDTLKFYFSGTGLKIIGMKANDTHTYDLYIDDKKVESDVDTNSSSTKRQQILSETTGLKNGIHKVELVVKQAKISLDAFEIIRDVEVTGLNITSTSDTINLNETNTMQMQAKYLPAGASGAGVTWSVKNNLGLPSNIASIDDEGLLTVNHLGSVVVCATDKADSTLTAQKTINVVKDVTTVKFDDRDSSITYSNNWSPWNESKHENGTVTESTTKDASFTFEFEGSGLGLYFMKLEAAGGYAGANIEVQIDGVSKGLFSTFTTVSGSEPKSKVFEDLDLENSKHSVTVIVKDCPADAPSGAKPKVSFDYYQVTKGNKDDGFDYTVLIDEMNKFKETDLSKYFNETANAYQAAFDQAKDKYEVAESQDEINNLVQLLKVKREALINKAEYKVQLNNLIVAWDGKDLSGYKESGVINLNNVLDAAKEVYHDTDASKQEVDQAIKNLNDAIDAL